MKSFINLTIVNFKLFFREPAAFFFTLIFPVLILILFGFIFGNEPDPNYGNYGYIDAEVPGLTAMIIGTVALMSIPIATATAREQKILRRYQASPMPPSAYLVADTIVNFAISLVGMIALVIVATLVFDLRFGGSWLEVLAGFILSGIGFLSIGYIIASLAPTARVAQVIGQFLFFPMFFLSGAALPRAIMPEGVQTVAEFMPLTHVVTLLQDLWFGDGWNTNAVIILLAMAIVGTFVAARTFRWE